MEEVKKLFKPEFINRIDEIIVFKSLNKTDLKNIASLLIKNLASRSEAQINIKLKAGAGVRDYLVEHFTNVKMGARPLKRGILGFIEDPLAVEILEGRINPGDEVTVSVKDDKAVFKVK